MKEVKTTDELVLKASGRCEDADTTLRILYPQVFKDAQLLEKVNLEEAHKNNISDEFRRKAQKLCKEMEELIYEAGKELEDFNDGNRIDLRRDRGYYIIAKLAYAHMPCSQDDDLVKVWERYVSKWSII